MFAPTTSVPLVSVSVPLIVILWLPSDTLLVRFRFRFKIEGVDEKTLSGNVNAVPPILLVVPKTKLADAPTVSVPVDCVIGVLPF